MPFFFSRREFDAAKRKYTKDFSEDGSHYVVMSNLADKAGRVTRLAHQDWSARVKAASGGSNEALVYVHGFNTTQTAMLKRADKIERELRKQGYGGTVVGFDWPSDGTPVLTYNADQGDARRAAPYLIADGVQALRVAGMKVSIIAHSMGAFLTMHGLRRTAGVWDVEHIVFAAADEHDVHLARGSNDAKLITKRSKSFTTYRSKADAVLLYSEVARNGGEKRLGRTGLPDPTDPAFVEIDMTEFYKTKVARPTGERSHMFYFEQKTFYKDLAGVLTGQSVNGRIRDGADNRFKY